MPILPVAYATEIYRPSGLQGCVESTGTQTTRKWDWDDIIALQCRIELTPQGICVTSVSMATSVPMATLKPITLATKIQ
eukprot:12201047-Ditylum_brightwellii.AAC.1